MGCHSEAYQIWQKSRHAHAYETLEKVGKNFDAECVSCHVVGLDKKEALFLSLILPPKRCPM